MQKDLQQLIADANIKGITTEQELLLSLITQILESTNETLLLEGHDELQQAVLEIAELRVSDNKRHNKTTIAINPSEKFYEVLARQKAVLHIKDDDNFSILLSSLKMLEHVFKKPYYKNTLKEILRNNLHKMKPTPLAFPFFGRDKEVGDIFRTLDRSYKNNVLIAGPSGVGKTTLVLAVLQKLRSDIIFQLYPGDNSIADRLINLLSIVNGSKVLLFLDEIFLFTPEQIQSIIENKQVVLIATANEDAFKKFEKNYPEIISKFETIILEEPIAPEVQQILSNRLQNLSQSYATSWDDDLLDEIYTLSKQYMPQFAFPSKGIALLEELVSLSKSQGISHLKKDLVRHMISEKTGIPIEDLTDFDKKD